MFTLSSLLWPLLCSVLTLQAPADAKPTPSTARGRDHFSSRPIQELAVVQFRDGRALLRVAGERAVIRVGDQVGRNRWQVAAVTSNHVLLQQGERFAVMEAQADGGSHPRMLSPAEVPAYLIQPPATATTQPKSKNPGKN